MRAPSICLYTWVTLFGLSTHSLIFMLNKALQFYAQTKIIPQLLSQVFKALKWLQYFIAGLSAYEMCQFFLTIVSTGS